ncbi:MULTISPECIES: TetR/AcrR family transcriptional regulator [Gluconacetobacter]|uniref:TetR/AcrR family transcriptional regulator n=4 Tax=Gluconacetobacter TaxID=89583 RepID=A0A7W4IE23_9PROT|nr:MULTISPECIES: TetR/AcrR family transcriptional regulator [Gluconacetobacter]MBB2161138.1 TetR/AcrR family transcriptional regulator [Gluconacetobacter sacchari]GBQ23336.1 TetR family transcriptional regulator [Gluconacetobacter sacchari DSM 12717]CAP55050.1 putative transcriptional regulator protein, TetR family [Gluconacetobacter diazotrophicus PA1 5]
MRAPRSGQRGPVDHERRDQIMTAAIEHFGHYGYKKTTMADLADAIGLSKAYIYKFFDSKKAIGEAICALQHGKMHADLQAIIEDNKSASDRMRRVFLALARNTVALFSHERKLHDIVYSAVEEEWTSSRSFVEALRGMVERLIHEGREGGEFERKTPVDETCHAIMLVLQSIYHPLLLEQHMDTLDDDAATLASLVLRSLAP